MEVVEAGEAKDPELPIARPPRKALWMWLEHLLLCRRRLCRTEGSWILCSNGSLRARPNTLRLACAYSRRVQ